MASNVEIILNYNRSELVKPGWSKSRLASTMKPAQLYNSLVGGPTGYVPGPMPEDLWREPNVGVIMKKPITHKTDWWENPFYDIYKIDPSLWQVGDPNNFLGLNDAGGSFAMYSQRDNSSGSPGEIASLAASVAETAILGVMLSELVWCMKTFFSLHPNEGWSVWVHPPGIFTERATDYMLVSFGGRYCLHVKMNGTVSLWVDLDYFYGGTGNWIEKAQFNLSKAGVDHNKPFQITVIPFGFSYLSFQFSQTFVSTNLLSSGSVSPNITNFLYDIQKEEGLTPEKDVSIDQYIKTYAAPLGVALRRFLYQYGFSWARVRYPEGETVLATVAESISQPLGTSPTLSEIGFNNGGNLFADIQNVDGNPWDPATDTYPVIRHHISPSPDTVYTPELWSINMEIPAVVEQASWTPRDLTGWTMVRFQRSVLCNISICEIKLENDPLIYSSLFHFWGPIRVLYAGIVVFDGYRVQPQPSISGPLVLCLTELQNHDMWLRLDERLISEYKFLDKLGVLQVIKELIKMAGFLDSDIHVIDPDGALTAIIFEGFTDPNEQKSINPDATVGDVIREIVQGYNLIPIRVRPVDGQWYIYLAPQYDPASPPSIKYFIGGHPFDTDDNNFTAHNYRITSEALEYTCAEAAFNGLIARASTSTGEGAEAVEGIIPATYADPDSVSNPANFWYIGRAKIKIVAPPEIPSCTTQDELEKNMRVFYERHHRTKPVLEFKGEWQPEVDVDTFIWVIGYNQDGTLSSYGAYRIDHIDVQVTYDLDSNFFQDTRWDTEASFTCIYVGIATDSGISMFTVDLPT